MKSLATPLEAPGPMKFYPSVTVRASDFPVIDELELGKETTVLVKVRKLSEEFPSEGNGPKTVRVQMRQMGKYDPEGRANPALVDLGGY